MFYFEKPFFRTAIIFSLNKTMRSIVSNDHRRLSGFPQGLMISQDQPQHDGEASVPSTIRRSRQAPPRAADTSLGAASSSNPAAHQPTNRGRCGPLRTANRSLNDTARSWATKHNYFRESIHSWDRFQRKGERSPSSAESYSLPSSSPFRLPSCTEG